MAERRTWYVDSSVLLRAIVDGSTAASRWFDEAATNGGRFVASRLLEVETRRVIRNLGGSQDAVTPYLDLFVLVSLADELLDEAMAIDEPLGGADSIHVATALRVGPSALTLVTHDAQMARAALRLGFDVLDPVTDDPNRGPVVAP